MLFPEVIPRRDEVIQNLANALRSEHGRVYLDASLLIHCYEMSTVARDELLVALEGFGARSRVPLWAAKETWEYLSKRPVERPLTSHSDQVRNAIDRFRTEARRYVDDDTIEDLTKAEFERQLETASAAFIALTKLVSNYQQKSGLTTARLRPFIEAQRLNSDLNSILKVVADTAETRFAHGVPPGFADGGRPLAESASDVSEEITERKNKGKKRNRYGDLIIWLEILEDCAKDSVEHLVVVTRDTNKGDWVYKPEKVADDQERPQPNAADLVTLPAPLLVHEAMRACPTVKSVNIVSVEMLAHVLFSVLKLPIPHLVAALQADNGERQLHERDDTKPVVTETESPARVDTSAREPVSFTSQDMSYEFTRGDDIDDSIRSLGLEEWRIQNQAIQKLEQRLGDASRDQIVQVGRGAVSAINGGALAPLEFLRRVLGSSTETLVKNHLLTGVLAQVYIADDGELKKPVATVELAEQIFALAGNNDFKPAYVAVLERLGAQRRSYLLLPNESLDVIALELILERTTLRGVRAFSHSLLEEQAPKSRLMNQLGRETTYTVVELLDELAREFVVPARLFSTELTPSFQLQVPEFIGYISWGPNTGTTLR